MSCMTSTEMKWSERVRDWRQSGESAVRFAAGKGFEASTLRYWASRFLRAERERGPRAPRRVAAGFVRLVGKSRSAAIAPSSEIVLEVGGVRMRIARGFDRELLAEVMDALGSGGSR